MILIPLAAAFLAWPASAEHAPRARFEKRPDVEQPARAQADADSQHDGPAPRQSQVFCRALARQTPAMRELTPPAQFITPRNEAKEQQSRLDLQANIDDLRRYLTTAVRCREALSGPDDAASLAELNASIGKMETELLKQKRLEKIYPPRVRI